MLLLGYGCASMNVASDFDPAADFGRYGSYAWADQETTAPEELDKLIKSSVERILATTGYFKTGPRGVPDFLIAWSGGLQDRFDATSRGYTYWRGYPVAEEASVTRYKEGTLTIDIIDVATKKLVWQGWAQGAADDAGRNADLAREAVSKILKGFPPR